MDTELDAARTTQDEEGVAMLATFFLMLVLAGLAFAVGVFSYNSQVTGKSQLLDRQAFYVAEAGGQRARQQFGAGAWSASSCTGAPNCTEAFPSASSIGEYVVTITGSNPITITSSGYVPNRTTPIAQRRVVESNVPISTSDGSNLSLSATAFASSSRGANVPARAKDGNLLTFWEANTAGPGSWLAMDLGSATSVEKIIVREQANITGLTIQHSDNNATWTTASGLSVTPTGSGNNQIYTATFTETTHRYFRSLFSTAGSGRRAARELESYDTGQTLGAGAVTTQW